MATRVTENEDPTAIGLSRRGWLAWPVTEVKRALEGPIVRNAASLYGATIVTSLLGFVYWFVAARLVPAQAVGIASALQSAAMFLGYFCVIGLNTLVISELSADKAAGPFADIDCGRHRRHRCVGPLRGGRDRTAVLVVGNP